VANALGPGSLVGATKVRNVPQLAIGSAVGFHGFSQVFFQTI